MTKHHLHLAAMTMLAASTACFDIVGPIDLDWGGGFGCCGFSTPFDVSPGHSFRMLRGDTTAFRVYSDSGHRRANWTATGAFRLVFGDSLASETATPDTAVVVRAISKGDGTIHAVSSTSSHTIIRTFRVVDSADVARVELGMPPSLSIRRGDSIPLFATLLDGENMFVKGNVTRWSVSDSARASVVTQTVTFGVASFTTTFLKSRDTGTVVVRGHFLDQVGTASVKITP